MERHEQEKEGSKEMNTTESNINPVNKEKKKNKQSLLECHTFQWGETENAIPYWCELLWMLELSRHQLERIFLSDTVVAMEKFNGTNIAMDKAGQVYSRKCYLPMDVTEFIHTNLNCVRQTRQSIESLETYLMSETGLVSDLFTNMIVYGELMCQHVKVYDEFTYKQRGVLNKWIPFGCLIQVNENQSVKDVDKF